MLIDDYNLTAVGGTLNVQYNVLFHIIIMTLTLSV